MQQSDRVLPDAELITRSAECRETHPEQRKRRKIVLGHGGALNLERRVRDHAHCVEVVDILADALAQRDRARERLGGRLGIGFLPSALDPVPTALPAPSVLLPLLTVSMMGRSQPSFWHFSFSSVTGDLYPTGNSGGGLAGFSSTLGSSLPLSLPPLPFPAFASFGSSFALSGFVALLELPALPERTTFAGLRRGAIVPAGFCAGLEIIKPESPWP